MHNLNQKSCLKVLDVTFDCILRNPRVLGKFLKGYFIRRVEGQRCKQIIKLLNVSYSIETRKVSKQYFIYDIALYEAPWIGLDLAVKNHFWITTKIQIVKKLVIQFIDVASKKEFF